MFANEGLIIQVDDDLEELEPSYQYYLYSFEGKFIKRTNNIYNTSSISNLQGYSYIGDWNENYIFYTYDNELEYITFIKVNKKRYITFSSKIKDSFFGKDFYSFPNDHMKIRNNNLYILRYRDTHAIISYISLDELFHE